MKIYKTYSFKGGESFITKKHKKELEDVVKSIESLDAITCFNKVSDEKTKKNQILFSPTHINKAIKVDLCSKGWTEKSEGKKGFTEPRHVFSGSRFREMDGMKNKVGLEIQFGKYAFMGYDIFSKMVIFNKLGKIDCGIEVVPVHELCKFMSTGVSDFDQLMIDFKYRGESNIDIPVLVIGIGLTPEEEKKRAKIQKLYIENKEEALKIIKPKKSQGALPGPKK